MEFNRWHFFSPVELCREGQISLFEITLPTPSSDHEIDNKEAEVFKNIDLCKNTDGKSFNSKISLRDLLLSSPSFQSCAEELFDLNTNSSSIIQTSCIDNFEAFSVRLSLDCANEIIKRKSLQDSQTVHPLLPTCIIGKSRQSISIEMLVEEVIRGIETLSNYSKLCGENLLADCLYAMLEKDLTCKGVVNGIWDSGWRTGFSLDAVEKVVNDLEKLVLTGLIEEVFA